MRSRNSGYSLLEVVVATLLMGLVIVPAMNFMTSAIRAGHELDLWNQMNVLAVGKLEEQLAIAATTFEEASSSGAFSGTGLGGVRYTVSRTTSPAAGGISDKLMVVEVRVWHDDNGNSVLDVDEADVVYATKLAHMEAYQGGL